MSKTEGGRNQKLKKALTNDGKNGKTFKRVKNTYEIKYTIEDSSPDILMPSNGGYNPKQKSMFVEEDDRIEDEGENEYDSEAERDGDGDGDGEG